MRTTHEGFIFEIRFVFALLVYRTSMQAKGSFEFRFISDESGSNNNQVLELQVECSDINFRFQFFLKSTFSC